MVSIDKIMAYEDGSLPEHEVIELFSELVKSGDAFILQGHYGRVATALIEANLLDRKGTINWELING